ncbi:MAG: hypothetical protein LBC80_05615 [Treponema sp.]|jgi:hypothetical protein|nr:hypothetical protein [Treponema sp.]
MKKIKQIFFVSLLAIGIISCAVNGDSVQRTAQEDMENYTGELGTFEGLDAQTELQILQDYFKPHLEWASHPVTINAISVFAYFGTYSGYVVVGINDPYIYFPGVVGPPYQIDGIQFPWNWPWTPIVWNNGQFYSMQELYNSGLFTRADLESIAKRGHSLGR